MLQVLWNGDDKALVREKVDRCSSDGVCPGGAWSISPVPFLFLFIYLFSFLYLFIFFLILFFF